jgi:hypothetical protein
MYAWLTKAGADISKGMLRRLFSFHPHNRNSTYGRKIVVCGSLASDYSTGEPDEAEVESIHLCTPADFSAPDSDEYTDAESAVVEAMEEEFKEKYAGEHRQEIDAAIQALLSSLRKEAEAATK